MRALVVDDQTVNRKQLQALLSRMGYRVDCAENGRDAVLLYILAAEQGQPYSFVSMDNEMPVMSGALAVEMIRAWERDHRTTSSRSMICFVSGDAVCKCTCQERYGSDCLTRFLLKPLDMGQFIELARSSEERSYRCDCDSPKCLKQPA